MHRNDESRADHAVVLGASMGGLLAARVLADFYRTVTVVERDALPADPSNRRGVPQGRHGHALMRRGSQIVEELFPGLLDDLRAGGAPVWDDGDLSKVHFQVAGHTITRSGRFADAEATTVYSPSRPFLEFHVRQRLRAVANVTFLAGHDVVGLTASTDSSRVTGVRILNHANVIEQELMADLIVDATGRGSRTPAFLEGLGYGRPIEDEVVVRLAYSTQALQIPPGTVEEKAILLGVKPGRPQTAAMFGYENDTWLFSLGGMMGCEPPTEFADMIICAEKFAPAQLIAALRSAEPIGEVARHRVPSNRWRRYDKMRRLPEGLLVVGDAICSFNPIYGQGMTVAALDALVLRDCLGDGEHDLSRRFFSASAKGIGVAWNMAVSSDLALPEVPGKRSISVRVSNLYTDWVLTAAESDPVVAEKFLRVVHMTDSPTRLLRPAVLFRVARPSHWRRRHAPHPVPSRGTIAVA